MGDRGAQEAYESVQKWTKKVDSITKQFVFVPIRAEAHWSLACIVNLDKLQVLDKISVCGK